MKLLLETWQKFLNEEAKLQGILKLCLFLMKGYMSLSLIKVF